jgi:class 3 adenylate cyclase
MEITRVWEPPESCGLIESWWRHHPEAFHVVKSPDGRLQAFYIIFEPDEVDRSLLDQDPFTLTWLKHLADNPVAEEERVLFCRRWLDRKSGENPTPAICACFLDVKRVYMELRPSLKRIYCPVKDLSIFKPILFPLGFTTLQTAKVTSDGIPYHTLMNDFGPSSADGWLAKIIGQELGEDITKKHGRMLVTVLFTDIVNSTEKAVASEDSRWQALLERHHILVREELAKHQGREVDTAGDGFFAIFDKPANAIRCASAVGEAIGGLGIDIRAGLHLGECEIMEDSVCGITVHIGARVASKAEPGEILVSSTLKEAVTGSDIRFKNRGVHELKGIPGSWNLFGLI